MRSGQFFEREIDHQDDAVVRASVLRLVPAVTREELACLFTLSQQAVWDRHFDFLSVGVWEAEQLDQRGWIEAQEIDHRPPPDAGYTECGPWFRPLRNRIGDGRPDWVTIIGAFKRRSKPVHVRTRLSDAGWRVLACVRGTEIPDIGVLDATAYQLQRVSAAWRARDYEVNLLVAAGMGTQQGGFEKLVRDHAMLDVHAALETLRAYLIPKLAMRIDPGLRDDLRALVRDLQPDAHIAHPDEGYQTVRWRLYWHQLGCEDRINEIIPILWELQSRPKQGLGRALKVAEKDKSAATGWTVQRLCKSLHRGKTTLAKWRSNAEPAIRGRTRGESFTLDELKRLADIADRHGDAEAATNIRLLVAAEAP